MSFLKKLIVLKNYLGFLIVGLLFAVIGGAVVFKGASDGSFGPMVFCLIGVVLALYAIYNIVKELNRGVEDHKQYNRVDPKTNPNAKLADEPEEDFVYHFTGKGNQSYVLEDSEGNILYQATTEQLLMVGGREFEFTNCLTNETVKHKVGAPVTTTMRASQAFEGFNMSSTFKIDGKDVWDLIAEKGYGFAFSLNGIAAHYNVQYYGLDAGFTELGGTGLVNEKYKDNPLGKVPTQGIYKVHCRKSDIEGFFLICFALSHTELVLE